MKYRFQHFIDISTSAESMQVLTFKVGGADVIKRCAHLFNAYKYFKLGKISVKFVPASTLPVDPLGMSYADTDPQTVDPRDQLNPGLVRITNGEDIMTDMSGVQAGAQVAMYEAMLLDPRWYKFNLQSGFKRSALPLYWQIGQLRQDMWPGAVMNVPSSNYNETLGITAVSTNSLQFRVNTVDNADGSGTSNAPTHHYDNNFSSPLGFFQVGHRGRIGWLPTDAYQWVSNGAAGEEVPMVNPVPEISVITAVLPKAYKTLYYYRVYITEEVSFSGLKSIAPESEIAGTTGYFRPLDNFTEAPGIYPRSPDFNQTDIPIGQGLYGQLNNGASRD